MTWYEFLLFFHISMAVIWVGGFALLAVVLVRSGLRTKITSATA